MSVNFFVYVLHILTFRVLISCDLQNDCSTCILTSPLGVGQYCCACFGEGLDPIHIDELACSGSEYRLSNCQYDLNTYEEYHREDWSVYCDTGKYVTNPNSQVYSFAHL